MAIGEFDLIRRYFHTEATVPELRRGIGDDAAIVDGLPGMTIATATWPASTGGPSTGDPSTERDGTASGGEVATALVAQLAADLPAHLALRFLLLGLTLEGDDEAWLDTFSSTLARAANEAGAVLIGGDTTRGPRRVVLHGIGVAR